ncbi:MAG: response regulator [Planctomycetota bacterium]|jgi:CheY-like chemotaxis protein/nitrogen-specific signal transduction histidine kinase
MNTNDNPEKHSNTQPGECSSAGSRADIGLQRQTATQTAQLCAKSELIDNMIYQIRTLSNAIIGFSDLLSTELLSQDQTEYVQEIHRAGQGLSALVNDVLDWTQLLSGKLQVSQTKFYVSDLIKDVQKRLYRAAKEKALDYQVVMDPEMPACIYSDYDQLFKCVLNLAISAIKYTPQGNIKLHVYSEQKGDKTFICFDVIDTNGGIAPEELERIFELTDYQLGTDKESFSQPNQGQTVAAGLALTKLLSEALGGTLEVSSQVDQELTFSLRIPAGVNPATEPKLGPLSWKQDIELQQPDEASCEEPSSSNVILLVEDQHSNRTVISLMLEALGVQVETAADGEEALAKAADNTYDLILMDIKMPRMDGYEATRQLRQRGIQTPIVALSAKVFDEQEHHQISMMFDGFLTKPVDSRKLSETLKKFIKRLSGPNDQVSQEETVVIQYEN